MERQLKERLIGAAVLVAVAVIMVPEMFSGGTTRKPDAQADTQTTTTALPKSYRIDLQAAHSSRSATPAIEPPAESPRDEQSVTTGSTSAASSSSTASLAAEDTDTATQVAVMSQSSKSPSKPMETNLKTSNAVNAAWAVQIGSFGTQEKAQQIAARLKAENFVPVVAPVQANGKTLYRVRVAMAAERAAAQASLEQLKVAYPGATIVPIKR